MINKNIIGILSIIVIITIIFSVQIKITDDINSKAEQNMFLDLIESINKLCKHPAVIKQEKFEISNFESTFTITNVNNNSLCIESTNRYYCERTKCIIQSDKNIINKSLNNELDNSKIFICALRKNDNNIINISCTESYNLN